MFYNRDLKQIINFILKQKTMQLIFATLFQFSLAYVVFNGFQISGSYIFIADTNTDVSIKSVIGIPCSFTQKQDVSNHFILNETSSRCSPAIPR